jgi:hypothetical protein
MGRAFAVRADYSSGEVRRLAQRGRSQLRRFSVPPTPRREEQFQAAIPAFVLRNVGGWLSKRTKPAIHAAVRFVARISCFRISSS